MIRNILIVEGLMAQVVGLILVAALLSARPRSIANRLLAAALLCVVFRQFLLVMKISGMFSSFPILFRLSFPLQLLAIPAFYLYTLALTTPDFKLQSRHVVHLIPSAGGLAWYFVLLAWGNPALFEFGPSYDRELYLRTIVKILVAIPYFIYCRRQVRTFALETKEHVSNVAHLKLRWLQTLLLTGYIALTVDLLDVAGGPGTSVWHLLPGLCLISLSVLAYLCMRVSPTLAHEVQCNKAENVRDLPVPGQEGDAGKRHLSDDELRRQKEHLTRVLESQALFLNPDLRLSDLADALGIRPYRVSEILNRGLETSFYELINRYRIAKAQELLASPASAHLNLLGIAMESGFRSKSVFNEVFKRATGMTPSEYRNREMTEPSDSVGRIARPGR